MLGRVGLDGETHVARVLLGLGAQRSRVRGQLVLDTLGLDRGQPLELGRLAARRLANLLGGLFGGFEDSRDALAEAGVARALTAGHGREVVVARVLVHPCRGKLVDRGSSGKAREGLTSW